MANIRGNLDFFFKLHQFNENFLDKNWKKIEDATVNVSVQYLEVC